jgi:hypothetical protein
LDCAPIGKTTANDAVARWHRHHKPVLQLVWAEGAFVGGALVGVAIVECPKAKALMSAGALEVTRLATDGRTPHVATRLLGRVAQDAAGRGCGRLVSYTRADEQGTCYRAAGWRPVAIVSGREWSGANKPARWLPGLYEPSTEIVDRVRWEIGRDAMSELDALRALGRRAA